MYHRSPCILYITTSKCACTKPNLDFFEIFEKCQFRSKFSKNAEFSLEWSLENHILFEILENRDFCCNFWKVSILARIVQKSLFWSEFSKNLNYSRNFRKITNRSKFSKNLDFGRNFRKSRFWVEIKKKNLNFGGNLF